jgi:hypothetical protein
MMPFAIGVIIAIFSSVFGIYQYFSNTEATEQTAAALAEALDMKEQGQALSERIRQVRRTSLTMGDDQKFTLERLLDIGAPGLEWRFVGQPRQYGANRALYRHTFRISGATTYPEVQALLERMNQLPGFVVHRMCFACTQTPRGTPETLRMTQIEGYLYVYDPNTLY